MNSKKAIAIWSKALVALLEGKGVSEQKKIIERLAEILRQKKKTYLLPEILQASGERFKRRRRLRLTLASEQSKETTERLAKKLAAYFGEDKIVQVDVDKSLIAGFVAKTEDRLIDASIKNFLNQLKNIYGQN